MRWADMDLLQHVNNVTYVDYLQEARIDMFAAHPEFEGGEDLAQGVVVVRTELEFVAPLVFRRRPILVDVWVTEVRAGSFTLAYEVYDDTEAGRVVHLRASTVLAAFVFASESPRRIGDVEREVLERYLEPAEPRARLSTEGAPRHVYPLQVRWSDIDAYRHVNNVKYIEYFQESRLRYFMDLHQKGDRFSDVVIARTDVDYRRPMLFRHEPYEVRSWVSHLGTSSFTIAAEVHDPLADDPRAAVLASAQVVVVGFDRATQRAAPLPPDQRARLEAELSPSS